MKTVLETGLSRCAVRILTVYKRRVTNSWPEMESASAAKSLLQSCSRMLKRGPPKNKEKRVKTVLETGLSCCAVRVLNCVQEMGD